MTSPADLQSWSSTFDGLLFDLDGTLVRASDGRAVPGAAALLAGLGSLPWGIVTGDRRSVAKERLARAGLPVPRVLITAGDTYASKPDPEPYLAGRARLATQDASGIAGTVVAFEDTPAGITSARKAGCQVIALTTSYPAVDLDEADVAVTDLTAIRISAPTGDDAAVLTAVNLR